jgi:hypothetical protein
VHELVVFPLALKILHENVTAYSFGTATHAMAGREDGSEFELSASGGIRDKPPHIRHGTKTDLPSTVVPLLLRFRGSLFYVVERYQTTAIPDVDCHKNLHRSVQKVRCRKKAK